MTLSEEQKQQVQVALFGPPSVQPAAALPPSAPLLQAEEETVRVAEQQQLGETLPEPPSVQPAEALPTAPPLIQAEGEIVQLVEQQRYENTAPASQTRSESPKETSLAERVEAIFLHLDKLAQQTTGDPDFTWTRSEKAKRSVKQLLADGRVVTQEKLSAVYLHMATMKPNPKTGFTWADKMSVTHVCENYDSIWLELVQSRQQRLNDASASKTPLRTLVVYGSTEQLPPSQPLPVVALQRNPPRRWFVGKGA